MEARDECVQRLPGLVHSFYLRGTVAKGIAVEGVSDIDTVVVIHGRREDIDRTWIDGFTQEAAARQPFHTGIEFAFVPLDTLRDPAGTSIWRFFIKTQCLCLWGEDLAPSLPRYRPGPALATHAPTLRLDVEEIRAELSASTDGMAVKECCQWLMKRFVRAGFELVMEREQSYTRDLHPCYRAFARHFPAQEPAMRQALQWAVFPTGSAAEILAFLDSFAPWLTTTIAETFPPMQ